jgi:adenosylmethionine-8-amino-7-oxononanoate aminotransferase
MTHVFSRSANPLPSVASAEGVWVTDSDGKRYLDGCGGALVVNLGHGRREVIETMTEQAGRVSYVHGTMFTSEVGEGYAEKLAAVLPVEDAYIYPVAGGSEAVETAFKMARAYHLAKGERARHKIISRFGSYHGNTRGALDASGRAPLRNPYLPWLDKAVRIPEVYEYRCPMPGHPHACGEAHAQWLERTLLEEGPGTVAAFIAEPIGGATLGATVPCGDYWDRMAEVCRRHGVLIIADEVLTGFGRTGKWFASDWWELKPDILTAGKGCGSGYWPLGFAACTGTIREALRETGFVHGFTYSHHIVGAAVGAKVLEILERDELIEASRTKGERLKALLTEALGEHPHVGDVRGRGTLVAVEFVQDRDTRRPFKRDERVTERVNAACKQAGLLVYPSTGSALRRDGDIINFGPPFVITDDELEQLVGVFSEAVRSVL